MQKLNTNYWILSLMFLIGLILLLATPLQRLNQGNPLTSGEETYYHLNTLDSNNAGFYDLVIKTLSLVMPLGAVIIIFPLFLAMLFSFLFYLTIKDYVNTELELYFSIGILFLTPAFITIHLGLTVYALALTLVMAVIYFYKQNSKIYLLFLFLLYLTIPFLGIILFIFLLLKINIKEKRIDFLLLLVFLFVTLVVGYFIPFISAPFMDINILFMPNSLFNFLGGKYGFVLFSFALGFWGLYVEENSFFNSWQRFIITILIFFSFFYEPLRLVFIPFIAFFAAKSLQNLMRREWFIPYLKELTVILFICMLLFATLSAVKENTNATPTINQKETYSFLNAVKEKNIEIRFAKVLTNPAYGEPLTYFSKLEAFSFSDRPQNVELANSLIKSRDYSYIREKLQKEKIAFIYIDDLMMQGNILDRPDQGILFVMEHNDNFKLIYSKGSEKVYYFVIWDEESILGNIN